MTRRLYIKIGGSLKIEDGSYYYIAIQNLCELFHIEYSKLLLYKVIDPEFIELIICISLENNEFTASLIKERIFLEDYVNKSINKIDYFTLYNDTDFQKIHDEVKKLADIYKIIYLVNNIT